MCVDINVYTHVYDTQIYIEYMYKYMCIYTIYSGAICLFIWLGSCSVALADLELIMLLSRFLRAGMIDIVSSWDEILHSFFLYAF